MYPIVGLGIARILLDPSGLCLAVRTRHARISTVIGPGLSGVHLCASWPRLWRCAGASEDNTTGRALRWLRCIGEEDEAGCSEPAAPRRYMPFRVSWLVILLTCCNHTMLVGGPRRRWYSGFFGRRRRRGLLRDQAHLRLIYSRISVCEVDGIRWIKGVAAYELRRPSSDKP